MNTISHLSAMLATLWATIFTFQTLSHEPLGGALFILFFGYVVMSIGAIDDDVYLVSGRKMMKFRGDRREPLSASSRVALAVTLFCFWVAAADFIW